MNNSAKIKALLNLTGKRQSALVQPLEMGSKQSLSNKFANDRWSAADLVRVARATGSRVGFQLPGGDWLFLDEDEYIPGK